jgi:hypothetical protein
MNSRKIAGLFVALFSAGWIAPLWFGMDTYLKLQHVKAQLPLVAGQPSFSFLHLAFNCFLVAFAWLGLVVAFWAYIGYNHLGRSREA